MESDKVSSKFKRATNCKTSQLNGELDLDVGESSETLSTYTNEKRLKKDDSDIAVDIKKGHGSDTEADINDLTLQGSTSKKTPPKDLSSPDPGNQASYSLPEGNAAAEYLDSASVKSVDRESDMDMDKNELSEETSHQIEQTDSVKDSEVKNYNPTPNVPRPKHKWVAPLAITRRQYGNSVQCCPNSFRYDCYGSLHMAERLELMYKMEKHEGCVNTLNFNASGTKLISGSDDYNVIIWDWTLSVPTLLYNSGHRSNVFQVKYLPFSSDSQIVSCARDGQVRIAELTSPGISDSTRKLAQHKGAVHKLAIPSDSPHTFISCGEDAAVLEIDLRNAKPEKLVVCKQQNKKVPLYSVFINPMKSYEFATSGRDPFVRIYDKRYMRQDEEVLRKWCPKHLVPGDCKTTVTSVVYNYDGTEILASYNDEDIYLLDSNATDTSQFLHKYKGHRNSQTVKSVNFFGPKSEYVISGSDCGFIFFWDKASEHIITYMHGDEAGVVNCLEPNPNMPVLASSGLDEDIKIWVPSCEDPPDLSALEEHITKNVRERDEEQSNEVDTLDEQMIWFLMQQIRQRHSGHDEESSSSSSDSDVESDFRSSVQCRQS